MTIAPLHDGSGGLTHFVGFQRDISERKRAEQELNVERDQLALLNQLVRHDIRNDMAVILRWGDRLYERVHSSFEYRSDCKHHRRAITLGGQRGSGHIASDLRVRKPLEQRCLP